MSESISHRETAKRQKIIAQIAQYLEANAGPIVSSRVGGSMSFARNHAIRVDSDIDLDVFVSFDQLVLINPFLGFLNGNIQFESSDSWNDFDLIAIDGNYQGVDINLWVLNTKTFDEVAQLKRGKIVFYSVKQLSYLKSYRIFNDGLCTLVRKVEDYGEGYKSYRPIMHNGQLISENYILNNMFFAFPIFGVEYSDEVVDMMWKAFLDKYPLATHEQIDVFIIDKITERFSPDFKAKLDQDIEVRFAYAKGSKIEKGSRRNP